MPKNSKTSAAVYLPEQQSLEALEDAARGCRGCPLYQEATQTVFGEGLSNARLVLVGEQPGNEEDLEGRPFIGPAGRLLDVLLEEAGIPRQQAYVTNAVKHFKFEYRGKRRIHKRPNTSEVRACQPWLAAELEIVKPDVLMLLGATAAQSLMGPSFKVTERRGEVLSTPWSDHTLASIHPSAVLRQRTGEERAAAREDLLADLKVAAELLEKL
jgi:DNA polymerase